MSEATRIEMTKPAADRVLIVEDEENARIGYEALLRRWGYEVLGVGSAEDALARFSEYAPARFLRGEKEKTRRLGNGALRRRGGYEARAVGGGEAPWARFFKFPPAFLIADVDLPGMNGLDLLARRGDELKTVPAIIITGK